MTLTVDTTTACRIIGKTRATLRAERNRKGTLITFTYKKKTPMYYLSGLIDYLDKKEGVTTEGILKQLKAA